MRPETTPAAAAKKRSYSNKPYSRPSKKKPSISSRPSSEDDKWAERFARLKQCCCPNPLLFRWNWWLSQQTSPASQKPFFDPGASTSKLPESAELSGPSLVRANGDAVPLRGDETQQNATQPVEAPSPGMATHLVQAPGADPDVLPSGTVDAALSADKTLTGGTVVQSTSEDDQHSDRNFRDGSPDSELTRDESTDQELSEEASYRETIRHGIIYGLAQDP